LISHVHLNCLSSLNCYIWSERTNHFVPSTFAKNWPFKLDGWCEYAPSDDCYSLTNRPVYLPMSLPTHECRLCHITWSPVESLREYISCLAASIAKSTVRRLIECAMWIWRLGRLQQVDSWPSSNYLTWRSSGRPLTTRPHATRRPHTTVHRRQLAGLYNKAVSVVTSVRCCMGSCRDCAMTSGLTARMDERQITWQVLRRPQPAINTTPLNCHR